MDLSTGQFQRQGLLGASGIYISEVMHVQPLDVDEDEFRAPDAHLRSKQLMRYEKLNLSIRENKGTALEMYLHSYDGLRNRHPGAGLCVKSWTS